MQPPAPISMCVTINIDGSQCEVDLKSSDCAGVSSCPTGNSRIKSTMPASRPTAQPIWL